MGLEEGAGLVEHLARGADWRELVHAGGDGAPGVLLYGATDEPPGDLLARPALERFLADAAQGWEAVVLALPEADALPAVPALTRALDALCIVHRARTRARARVAEAARALRAAGARELSGVLVERR
jgi:Mrp family chromosome partitioning ATPase